MRKFVRGFMTSVDTKLLEASPAKIGKTGNIVLDRINEEVESQRNKMQRENSVEDFRFELESTSQAVQDTDLTPAKAQVSEGSMPCGSVDRQDGSADSPLSKS